MQILTSSPCSRYVNVGLFYLRQLFFANFDIKVHTDKGAHIHLSPKGNVTNAKPEPADYTLLWNNLRESISLVKADAPTPGQGTFNHIAGGYDAGTVHRTESY